MALRKVWTKAAKGRLSPKEQCKLWALRQVLQLLGKDEAQYDWGSKQVLVEGGAVGPAGVAKGGEGMVRLRLVDSGAMCVPRV